MKILVLHGPNLNLFGRREPHIYGTTTLAEINAKLTALAGQLGVELETLQSNHEGVLVDKLHDGIDLLDGALLNPAGLTQHGVALHDAIKAMPFPVLEIHMSNIAAREVWRDGVHRVAGGEGHDPGIGMALLHRRPVGARRSGARGQGTSDARPDADRELGDGARMTMTDVSPRVRQAIDGLLIAACLALTTVGAARAQDDGATSQSSAPRTAEGDYVGPREVVELDGRLIFSAYNPRHGLELWRADPATGSASLAADIRPAGAAPGRAG
jgi:3-dehydroquinate dehydratase-2